MLDTLVLSTHGRGLYRFDDRVQAVLAACGAQQGLLTVFVRHTSASLLIQENADPDVLGDLERFFLQLVPDGDTPAGRALYRHTEEGPDDMPAHIRGALTQTSIGIPFDEGRLLLGTWQGLYLWEHRAVSHQRKVVVHIG